MLRKSVLVLTAALLAAFAAPSSAQGTPAPSRPSAGAPSTNGNGDNQGSAGRQHRGGGHHGKGMHHGRRSHGGNALHTGYRAHGRYGVRGVRGGHGRRGGMRSQRSGYGRRMYRNGGARMQHQRRRMPPV